MRGEPEDRLRPCGNDVAFDLTLCS